jgi:type III pantothenate kinase
MSPFPLVAVDIGNARTKLGSFRSWADGAWPTPDRTLQIENAAGPFDSLEAWLEMLDTRPVSWWIGSVNRQAETRLVDWLHNHRPDDAVTLLAACDLPLRVELARPDRVGVDRLLDAVAANRLRAPGRPAIVVDAGTAITVDLVSAEGVFRGGAILPGIGMSARALHEFTDRLPLVETSELADRPTAVGTSTEQAIASGLFWGAVGAIRELIRQMTASPSPDNVAAACEPDVFLTGGGAAVADLLGRSARSVPELTLAGIALTARAMGAK